MQEKKIRVMHCIPTLQFGGAEQLLVDIARRYDRERFEMAVVTLVAQGAIAEELRALNMRVISFEKKSRLGLHLVWSLWQFFRQEKPDIVHTHLFGADAWGKTAAFFARISAGGRLPRIVSTEHNTWYDESWFKHRIKCVLSWLSDRVIAVSKAVADYAAREESVSRRRIVVIHNRVDVDRFASLPIPEKKEGLGYGQAGVPVRFLSIGRLEKQKGFDLLLDAFARLDRLRWKNAETQKTSPRERPPADFSWELTIVGAGSQLSNLEDQAQELGIDARVHFFGTTNEMPQVYAQHDVFVLASRWEGLGLVLMEAMAAGRPVIATRVGGIPEIVEHGRTGLLVPTEDVAALSGALHTAIEDRAAMQALASAARAHALKHFRIENMVRQYEALYLQLLAQK